MKLIPPYVFGNDNDIRHRLDAWLALQPDAICVHQRRQRCRLYHQNRILDQLTARRLPHKLVSHPFSLASLFFIASTTRLTPRIIPSSPFSLNPLTSPAATTHFVAVNINTLSISRTSLISSFCSIQKSLPLLCASKTSVRGGSPSCRTLIQILESLYWYTSTCRSLSSETTPHGPLARSRSASSALRMAPTNPLVRSHRSLADSNLYITPDRSLRSLASCSLRAAISCGGGGGAVGGY
ncbi:hypothetical protein K456DRAFT_1734473 [Colletotrichum gloeosporioides 23]|nr:hypothetical protein K456DRAFT_1734473 [Colletotrichum gloeosporioides 23]